LSSEGGWAVRCLAVLGQHRLSRRDKALIVQQIDLVKRVQELINHVRRYPQPKPDGEGRTDSPIVSRSITQRQKRTQFLRNGDPPVSKLERITQEKIGSPILNDRTDVKGAQFGELGMR
jgi:hypothetical protein